MLRKLNVKQRLVKFQKALAGTMKYLAGVTMSALRIFRKEKGIRMKRYRAGIVFGLLMISLLLLSYFFSGNTVGSLAKIILWSFAVTLLLIMFIAGVILLRKLPRRKRPTVTSVTPSSGPAALTQGTITKTVPNHTLGDVFLDSLTYPVTWILLVTMLGAMWWYSPKLITTPNLVWISAVLWVLYLFVARARMASKIRNGGKEKAAYPGLTTTTMLLFRLAFLSTLLVGAYYVFMAPEGAWEELTGKKLPLSGQTLGGPKDPLIPPGVPREPNLTSKDLGENWWVEYVAANPQYVVPQGAWNGKRIHILPKPRREVTDAANLTLGFGEAFADLDIELKSTPGSCGYVSHKRASKTCVGDWKDRGGKISGYYYLEVDTWGTAFTAYLYGPNSLPNRDNFGIWSSPPIPKIMLRFFRKR